MCSLPGQVGVAICFSQLGLERGESHTLLRHLSNPAFKHLTSLVSSPPLACIIIIAMCACRQATSKVDDRDRLQVGRHLCMEAEHLEKQRSLRRTPRAQSHQHARSG